MQDKQLQSFIEHYNHPSIKPRDPKIGQIVKSSKTPLELQNKIKEALVAKLTDEFISLRDRIRQKLKQGEDKYIEDIQCMSIPLKIRIFAATGKKQDFYKVKKLMHDLDKDLRTKD